MLFTYVNLGSTPPFSPTDIANCVLWLDAADTATITETAGSVSQWDDKSGNGYNAVQPTGTNQPTTNSRTVNGLNAIDFDGSDDFFDISASRGAISSTDITMFFVYATDATGTTQRLIGYDSGASTFNSMAHLSASVEFRIGATTTFTYSRTADTNAHILAQAQDIAGGMRYGYYDGNSTSAAGGSSTSYNSTSRIGRTTSGAAPLNGVVCEVINYSRNLSDSEKNQVGNYLETKWGATWTDI